MLTCWCGGCTASAMIAKHWQCGVVRSSCAAAAKALHTVGAVLLLTQASMDAELTVMMPLTLLLAKGPRPV